MNVLFSVFSFLFCLAGIKKKSSRDNYDEKNIFIMSRDCCKIQFNFFTTNYKSAKKNYTKHRGLGEVFSTTKRIAKTDLEGKSSQV